jgi:hypothetical protein
VPHVRRSHSRASIQRLSRPSIRGHYFFGRSNEASVLEHIAVVYFPIYSVVVVLHACVNQYAPMIGLTRITLFFLETLKVTSSCPRFRIV